MTHDKNMSRKGETDEAKNQKKILVVEDGPEIQQLLFFCLELAGYSCSIVDVQGGSSLAWIEQSTLLPPDGIIFDVDSSSQHFKEPLGFFQAFCSRWQECAQMPLLVLLTTNQDRGEVLQREGYSVVMKPFRTQDLLDVLKTALRSKRDEDQKSS